MIFRKKRESHDIYQKYAYLSADLYGTIGTTQRRGKGIPDMEQNPILHAKLSMDSDIPL